MKNIVDMKIGINNTLWTLYLNIDVVKSQNLLNYSSMR